MAKPKSPPSALVVAAEALEEALAGHGRATRELLKLSLDSKKNVLRASEAVTRLVQHEDELAAGMRDLGAALNQARDAQQVEAEQGQARAAEIVERRAVLERLLDRQEMLGQAVRAVGSLLEQLRAGGDDSASDAGLGEVLARIDDLGSLADGFARDAHTAGFADLASEGHAIRQQLQAVAARAGKLRPNRPQA
jgi:hypothetical protein